MPFIKKYGTRAQVMNGTVEMTTGKLKKSDLVMSKDGRIRSRKKSNAMKSVNKPNFIKALTKARKNLNIFKGSNGKMIFPNKSPSASSTLGGKLYSEANRIYTDMKSKYIKK